MKEWGKSPPRDQPNHGAEVFNTNDKKPLRYSRDSFVKELIGKNIRISLTTREVFEGTLRELGMYDFLIETKVAEKIIISGKEVTRDSQRQRIFMKSSVVWVEVL